MELLYPALRGLHILALCTLSGGAVSLTCFTRGALRATMAHRLRRVLVACALLLMVTTVGLYLTQAGLMGDGPADMLNPEVLRAVAGTRFGNVWLVQGGFAAATLAALCVSGRVLLLILAGAQLALLAWTGHAAMNDGPLGALQRLNHSLHLLSAAWWIGGLLPLLICMRLGREPALREDAIRAMRRFSLSGHAAVAGVVLTGVLNGLIITGFRWHGFTPWLQLLMVKVGLVAGMVAIALYNRYVLVPRFHAGPDAIARFIRLTQAEMLLGVLVIATVTLLATWAPF